MKLMRKERGVFTMGKIQQSYSNDFKIQAVRYMQEQAKTLPEIADELKISVETLYKWKGKYEHFDKQAAAKEDKARQLEQLLKEKEREQIELKEEVAILKKAMHIFGQERN
ncbi:transposase [Paenibacillus eucommiae]|uniref:Transposase n=1 Tax=Paenibacillus eucommiae TaxID=1355755 RepID=A0ABS4IQB7_9BACL|nr:transposase [Paenibacillus eucommiae]MBP1989096.1 transposase [Paenibacillus eucommiae]